MLESYEELREKRADSLDKIEQIYKELTQGEAQLNSLVDEADDLEEQQQVRETHIETD